MNNSLPAENFLVPVAAVVAAVVVGNLLIDNSLYVV
jgi:hypothetical protein